MIFLYLFLTSTTRYSNFEDCALAVLNAAKNMNLKEDSLFLIRDAFYKTNMLESKKYLLKGKITSGSSLLENVKIEV